MGKILRNVYVLIGLRLVANSRRILMKDVMLIFYTSNYLNIPQGSHTLTVSVSPNVS